MLAAKDYPDVKVVSGDLEQCVSSLRQQPGKDIWLFGGGELFRSLLQARLVDTVEVSIIPVLLGGGIPLLPARSERAKLKLTAHTVDKTGIVSLEYAVRADN